MQVPVVAPVEVLEHMTNFCQVHYAHIIYRLWFPFSLSLSLQGQGRDD